MLGTKCPSMTSTWIQSAPADSTVRISSPSLAKSAERMDGATMSGRITASGKVRVTRAGQTGNAARHPCTGLFNALRKRAVPTVSANAAGGRSETGPARNRARQGRGQRNPWLPASGRCCGCRRSDRWRTRGPARAQEDKSGERDHGERESKSQSGQFHDKQRIGAKVVDDAVHRGDRKCRHGNHAQAVDAFTLGLDKGIAGNATDNSRAKSAPGDDRQ